MDSKPKNFKKSIFNSMNPMALLADAKKPTIRQFLIDFYTDRKLLDKIQDVDSLVFYYKGKYGDLFKELDKRYGTNFSQNPPVQEEVRKSEYVSTTSAQNYKRNPKPSVNKVILLGNSGVGKTNLLSRLNTGEFSDEFCSTIGVEFLTHMMDIDGDPVKAQIWDTAGQERFNAMMSTYYRKAIGAFLVYDVSDVQSLVSIKDWLEQLLNVADPNLHTILVGNKCDISESERKVRREDAERFAAAHHMLYIETSAKTGENVEAAFRDLLTVIHRSNESQNTDRMATVDLSNKNTEVEEYSDCCT